MITTIRYSRCPVCTGDKIEYRLTAQDHTVSRETFEIWECNGCTARFTMDVPPAEAIGKYYQSTEYISHSNTKKGIINTMYHWVRNFTLVSKRRLVRKFTDRHTGVLLDIGAGTGAFSNVMQKGGWHVTAMEPDETARQNARSQYQLELKLPGELYDQPAGHFDAITLWHVLEHVHDLHGYFDTFHRILKDQGTLFIAVPNYTSHDADIYREYWAAYDVPRHLYHFSPQSIDILAEQHGMQVVAYKRMWFDSFYVSMLSEQYRNGYNNIITAFWNGCLSNWEAFKDAARCSSVIYVIRKK